MKKTRKNKPVYKRIRKRWAINPKTRIKKSKKKYNRRKGKKIVEEDA
jgi:hypothetical protein